MADRSKHHFVPRMLLKHFSWDGININKYNKIKREKGPPVPYRPQCQKKYLYGKDGRIEDALGKYETQVDTILVSMIKECIVPMTLPNSRLLNDDRIRRFLLRYVYIQYSRVLKVKDIVSERMNEEFEIMKENSRGDLRSVLKKISDANGGASDDYINDVIDSVSIKIKGLYHEVFKVAEEEYSKNTHLKGVLLFNTTGVPFVTSDNPVIYKVSKFYDERVDVPSFLMPVSPMHYLFFFDERYFSVLGNDGVMYVTNRQEVNYINALQYYNSRGNVYFSKLFTDVMLRDMLMVNVDGGNICKHIKGISLRERYVNNITIPLGGHAR